MKPKQIMLIAGEPSGDTLAAELVTALRQELSASDSDYTADSQPLHTGLEPRFFGAGGPRMKAAGVELAHDLTEHSIIGIPGVNDYLRGRKIFNSLLTLALNRQPDVIIGVDYNYFNLKFAHAIKQYAQSRNGWFHDWKPKLVKLVSPQVWASREDRVYQIARDFDLLLSIIPFEKAWYARRVKNFPVEFIGHPMVDRFASEGRVPRVPNFKTGSSAEPEILLLPGSRTKEVQRHLPVMLDALQMIRQKIPGTRAKIILPDRSLAELAKSFGPPTEVQIQIGDLSASLAQADLALASTGTVTMECAFFGVPAVTLYKTSFLTYEIGKRIVKVKSLTMPNLLAGEEVFPEFVQNTATPENISRAALELLRSETRRAEIKVKLAKVVSSLGGPGASLRAAQAIRNLLV